MKNTGIYSIVNISNHMNYVGSAVDLRERFKKHIKELNLNEHGNKRLQNSWNKYGEANFFFMIREFVQDRNKLIEREQYWIDFLKSSNRNLGYNIRLIAKSNLGLKWTDEHKAKIGAAHKGVIRSDEYKKKMSEVKKGLIKSPEWQAKINASPNLASRRDREKWPHELGFKCICNECKEKRKERDLKAKLLRTKALPYIMLDLRL